MSVMVGNAADRANIIAYSTPSGAQPRRRPRRARRPRLHQSYWGKGRRTRSCFAQAGIRKSGSTRPGYRALRGPAPDHAQNARQASCLHRSLGEDRHDADQSDRYKGRRMRDARQPTAAIDATTCHALDISGRTPDGCRRRTVVWRSRMSASCAVRRMAT
jgi:hypothetical protein